MGSVILSYFHDTEDVFLGLWRLICKIDDPELFSEFCSPHLFEFSYDGFNKDLFTRYHTKSERREMLRAVKETKNIFESLFTPLSRNLGKSPDRYTVRYIHPLLRDIFYFALDEGDKDTYVMILSAYEFFLNEEIQKAREFYKSSAGAKLHLGDRDNYVADSITKRKLVFYLDIDNKLSLFERDLSERAQMLTSKSIIRRIGE